MTSTDYPMRLAVVAAIIDESADGPLRSSARLGREIRAKAESAAEAVPTPSERALAEALHDANHRDASVTDHAIAELLLLADDVPDSDKLATGLSQALLPHEDSWPAAAGDDCRSVFADLYRRLALHELNSQVRNEAAAALGRLIRG